MRRRWLMIGMGAILLVLLTSALVGAWKIYEQAQSYKGMQMSNPQPAPDFQLSDMNGQSFSMHDQRDKVSLLFFGYTHCPDVCPATLAIYRDLASRLNEKNLVDQVRLVFITVDPERDTPERLREYLPRFGEHVVGLTGSREELEPVWKSYGVASERIEMPGSALGYAMAHPSWVYLIDQQGLVQLTYPFGFTTDDFEHDITLMLKRGGGRA